MMIQIFQNPIINMLILNLNSTFWIQYLEQIKPENFTEFGLIKDTNKMIEPSKDKFIPWEVDYEYQQYFPYDDFVNLFSSQKEKYKFKQYLPNLNENQSLQLIRTIPHAVHHLNEFCINLLTKKDFDQFCSNGTTRNVNDKFKYEVLNHFKEIENKFEILKFGNFTQKDVNYNLQEISGKSICNFRKYKYHKSFAIYTEDIEFKNEIENFDDLLKFSYCPVCINICRQYFYYYYNSKSALKVYSNIVYSVESTDNYDFLLPLYAGTNILSAVAMIAGCVLYTVTPELRKNVYSKSTLYHMLALACYYAVSGIGEVFEIVLYKNLFDNTLYNNEKIFSVSDFDMNRIICTITGSITWYFSLAMLFWLNCIFMDMVLTFRAGVKIIPQRIRLAIYASFSWTTPAFLAAVIFSIAYHLDEDFTTKISHLCYLNYDTFSNGLLYVPYVIGRSWQIIAGVSFLVNILLVLWISAIICSVSRNISTISDRRAVNRIDTNRLGIYVKLISMTGFQWIVMVILWKLKLNLFDVSSLRYEHVISSLPIIGNLQGIAAFIILICNKNTIRTVNTNTSNMVLSLKSSISESFTSVV